MFKSNQMKIPDFTTKGYLPTGIHVCSGKEFIETFCKSDTREKYIKPVTDIFDFAMSKNATHLFIGGSYITRNENPADFDCVMVFQEDKYIPAQTEHVSITGLRFDILYASLESPTIIDSYIKLFTTGRFGSIDIGIIQVDLYQSNEQWQIKHEPDDATFEIIKRVYNDRALVEIHERAGILVTIHGLYSKAEWNVEMAPIASSQGWIFAPFVYETNNADLLFSEAKRSKVVNEFREWIYDLQQRFNAKVSVIAHSFGTFIIASYLEGFEAKEFPPVVFDGVILTGSILNTAFEWEKFRYKSVGRVYNMIAPNDEWVKFMLESDLKRFIGMSTYFGRAGLEGFKKSSQILTQSTNRIFTHTNTIKRDIIETKWMPFLNANRGILERDLFLKDFE